MRNFLKKILALAIILWMFGQLAANSFASYNDDLSDIRYEIKNTQEELETIKNWEKYISKINSFVSKINDKQVEILEKKLNIIKYKLLNKDNIISKKEEKILLIINYISLKLIERRLLKENQAKKDIFKNTLSTSDTKKVNDELVKIQKNLLKQGVSNFEKILGELEKYSNYEERGNFKANVNFDYDKIGKSKIELKLKDYIAKNSWFDAQFKSKIEAIIDAAPKGEKEVKMKINAFVDYILKDQNYYVLLKDLKIVDDKDILKLDSQIEKIKEIAAKNKYIHFKDKNAAQVFAKLKEFTPQNILEQGNSIVAKPLFTAYKKEGNKFYLIPSKYGCDTAKTLAQTFDPFNGNTCSDSQYQDLLDNIADSKTKFYIDFSEKNTVIGFEWNKAKDDIDEFNWNITFSDKYIEEINFIVKPNQKEYPGEWASLNFVRAKKLDAKIYVKLWNIKFNLVSSLDSANRFKSIDLKYNIGEKNNWELTLKNRKITGKYTGEWYNSKYVWVISGKTDTSNRLSTLKIENQYINSSEWNPGETNTIFTYDYGKYSIDNKYSSEWSKSDLKASFKISRNVLSEANFNLQVSQKESSYDENFNRVYTWDFRKVVDSNIELKNKNIKWETKIFTKDKEFLKITNTWRLEEDKFELNNKIEFAENPLPYYYTWTGSTEQKLESNLNIKTDTSSNQNNFNIYFDTKLDDKKIIEIELDNKSRRTYKKVEITAPLPNDTIEAKDAFSNPELY